MPFAAILPLLRVDSGTDTDCCRATDATPQPRARVEQSRAGCGGRPIADWYPVPRSAGRFHGCGSFCPPRHMFREIAPPPPELRCYFPTFFYARSGLCAHRGYAAPFRRGTPGLGCLCCHYTATRPSLPLGGVRSRRGAVRLVTSLTSSVFRHSVPRLLLLLRVSHVARAFRLRAFRALYACTLRASIITTRRKRPRCAAFVACATRNNPPTPHTWGAYTLYIC